MSNRDLLKEAIADAKAVKEMAISNAKAALEEAFTPQLKSMLEKKLTEMDEEDDKEMEEAKMHDKEDSMEEAKHDKEADTMSEEELEELLAELEEGDEKEHEMEEAKDHEEKMEEADDKEEMHEEEEEPEADEEEKEEEEFDLEEMSEEDLKAFIEDVVDEMIEAGELEAGEEEMEAPEMEASEEEVTDEEEVEEPMMEGKEEVEEAMGPMVNDLVQMITDSGITDNVHQAHAIIAGLGAAGIGAGAALKNAVSAMVKKAKGAMKEEVETLEESTPEIIQQGMEMLKNVGITNAHTAQMVLAGLGAFGTIGGSALLAKITDFVKSFKKGKAEIDETYHDDKEVHETIETLKAELNEVNLLNSKLLYTNKIFKAKNLSEAQKVKVLTTFDKAESVKEVKLVYETLLEGLTTTASNTKEAIKESKSFASKAVGTSPKKPVVETDGMVSRFQRLAGIK